MNVDETNTDDLELATAIEPDDETDVDTEAQASAEDDDEPDTDADEGQGGEGEPEEIEYAEIELNGKKYQVPVELKDGYLMQSDYTRKTQEVAEQRKAIEAQEAEIKNRAQVSEQELNARAELLVINQRLQEYQQVDWNAWQDEDPFAAQKGWIEFQQLERRAGHTWQSLQTAEQQRSETAKQEVAKRIQETREFAAKEIKGWSPEVDAKIIDFATKDMGISTEILAREINPVRYKILHLAWIGQQSIQKQTAAKPSPTVQNLKPLAKVSPKGGAPARKSMDEMDVNEFAAYRNAQEAKAARR